MPLASPEPLATATVAGVRLDLAVADITTLALDAIVNAANTSLLGGGGVDGAIHRAAGQELLAECRRLGGCETGDAKITRGYLLEAKYVIHAVGPVWGGDPVESDRLLASCYRKALRLAREKQLTSIAFPAISTGIYRFPADRAASVALAAVKSEIESDRASLRRIVFCCFSRDAAEHYQAAFASGGFE
ncbi:MAG: O-acetyl-ADP-ribose deacetylase [Hyphomicrobiales bacterium]